ncbi:MAG: hypothetical protein HY236_12175, partial [Acidobacteria bacterium]|nr:hypothetical protein [Acidobacteriota bacterium]
GEPVETPPDLLQFYPELVDISKNAPVQGSLFGPGAAGRGLRRTTTPDGCEPRTAATPAACSQAK